jgi:hypothetical protein
MVREGYEWINTIDPSDYETFFSFDGSSLAAHWRPVNVRRVRADKCHAFMASDFPWLGSSTLVLRRRARDVLAPILAAHGEILPLETDDDVELSVFNVTTVLDALDLEHSSVMLIPKTDKIMRVKKAAFHTPLLRGVDIFRLPHRASPTYLSRRFVDVANGAALVGLDFNLVWSDPS